MEGAFIDWAGILNSPNIRFLSHRMCDGTNLPDLLR